MTQENQSYLRFSLEESVWFQKGQEVEELYSISLDSNVTLTEDEHYVYIKGTLDLSGEYTNDRGDEEEEDFTNIFLPKSVQSVERHPNGFYEFMHRFPVDITIPSSRIVSLDDIEVSIHTFDYFIPERNSLKLQADLIISGIYSEAEDQEEPADDEDDFDFEWEDENDEMDIADETRVEDADDEAVEVEISDVLNQLDELVARAESLADELETESETSEIVNQRTGEEEAIIEDTVVDKKSKPSEEYEEEAPVQKIAAVPPIPDFQPAFRKPEENEDELYEPFIVEAKRTPEAEKAEPVYISKKQDIPPFDVPVLKNQEEKQVQPIERETEPVVAKEKEQEVVEARVESTEKEVVTAKAENQEKMAKEREASQQQEPLLVKEEEKKREVAEVRVENTEKEVVTAKAENQEKVAKEREVILQQEPLVKEEVKEQEVAAVVQENKDKIAKEREDVTLLHLVQKSRRPAAPAEQKQEAKQAEQSETKESLSIADFFSRKQEDEHVRVKVCIVQKGETVEDLAERYSISVQTILQSNELQPNQDVYEGQVLYIRQSTTFKKSITRLGSEQ